ncbi:hypothetical protein COHA_006466 [Chlorella ohadii]|uniref:Uncharacterized protein n=1 Tax=Chlorella ohadii TaxID=2649997 RepID=A0AAD5DKG2_9CHLO|nr:hypothetical protein COHA_006466 [Chlorella ohadii]
MTAATAAAPAAAFAPGGSKQAADSGATVEAAISAMAAAVQRGDFAGAEAAGAAAPANLALPRSCLSGLRPISEGAQAGVYAAQLAPARLVASLEGGSGELDAEELEGSLAVAVKKPRIRETADLERFRREVALLAQLRHPHIVHLLGARLLPPDYLAVLALEHTNAAAELHSAGWRPAWPQVLCLGAQLALAVTHIHAAGYVHRDIKPANLLLDEGRAAARPADRGRAAPAAELASGDVTHTKPTGGFHKQHMVGTLEYMSPEVLLGSPASCASDVFALAVTLNELATGMVPYSDCTRDNPLAHTVLEMAGDAEMLDAEAAEADFTGGSPSSSCAAGLGGGSPTAVASPASSSPSSSATGTLPCWLAASPQQQQSAAAQQGVAQQQAQQQQVQVGTFLTPGRRDAMEDAVVVLHDVCAAAGTPGCTALGVFDGHRGAAAADYLTANLQRHLVQQLGSSGSAAAALAGTLADADVAFRAEQDAAWAARLARMGVTRSIGDADLKIQGVSAEAETAELALQPGDAFVIVATDGLWDRVSNEEAVALVQDTVKHPAMCAQRLAVDALARGGGDNVAVAVMFLPGHGTTAERVYHAGQLKYHGAAAAKRASGPGLSADELRDTY